MIAYLLLCLLLGASLPSTQGRKLVRPDSHRMLSEQDATEVFALPDSVVAGQPSPLLNAPPVAGWVTVAASRSNSSYADDESLENRIIDGTIDDNNAAFPYASFLEWDMGGGDVATCTGSLIAPGWVITAAHCLTYGGSDAQPSQIKVWIYGVWYDAAAVYAHSGYFGNEGPTDQPSNDIGLVQLVQTSSVSPVALPDAQSQLRAGSTVWAAGYGITESGEDSDVLRYTDLTTFSNDDQTQCPAQGFTDNFCAGGTSGYTCQGDSGGPVVLPTETGDVLVGLTSWGPTDCRSPYSFYVTVQSHLDWISATMSGSTSSGSGGSGSWWDDITSTVSDAVSTIECWFSSC